MIVLIIETAQDLHVSIEPGSKLLQIFIFSLKEPRLLDELH